jgi:hypothetical protein
MINIIGMSFTPMHKVVESFIFFIHKLLKVCGEFQLIIAACIRVAIIARY